MTDFHDSYSTDAQTHDLPVSNIEDNATAGGRTEFDVRKLPLCQASRNQLGGICLSAMQFNQH
jgi:hypothetical protein